MLCADNVIIGLDGEIRPVNFAEAPNRKILSNAFVDLGKKLLQSAREGDIDAVHDLMSKGAPFTTDWLGFSPLHLAVINNHIELCDVLIRAGIGKDGRTKVDRTPLHFAAYHGHIEILKILLYSGAEVDCRDMLKMTPLHWAIENGHEECACFLLNFGAFPRAESKFYKTPLSIAMEMGWTEMVELLEMSTNVEATKSIIDSVQDVDMNENENKESPHKIKTKFNHTDTIEIENDTTMTDKEETLSQADETNQATVQLLKDHGIAMIPNDNTNTVTSAFQSGRQIVLSDAGKLVLRECKVQNEANKPMKVTKRPIILPRSKLKETKVYTVSSSQFLAMTKPNNAIPMNIVKNTNNLGNNLNVVKNISNLGNNLNLVMNQSKILNTITNKSPPLLLVKKLPGNAPSKSDLIQIKPKIVQLNSGSNLNNVKILLNNQNVGKIINSNANVPSLCPISVEGKNDNIKNKTSQQEDKLTKELVITKNQLNSAKSQIENYKKRITELETQLELYKSKSSKESLHQGNDMISLS